MTYISEDGRELEIGSFGFGDYQIAYALCSYGDIIKFFPGKDGDSVGIFLADTMGHDKDLGSDFSRYMNRVRKYGWGTRADSEKELSFLSRNFPRRDKDLELSPWQPVGALLQVRVDNEYINLANAGIEKPILMDRTGNIEYLDLKGHLEFYNRTVHSSLYEKLMDSGEMILLRSDGMHDNMYHVNNTSPDDEDYRLDHFLYENRHMTSEKLVSLITDVDGFGSCFLPKDDRYDDVSLVIVKRN
ncbi:MAG: SpoIIE family protein phosphatase [Candidatus Woesearchaeota archaeon]